MAQSTSGNKYSYLKFSISILFIGLSLELSSQTYNTNIENANKVQVEKGVIKITRADNVVIGKIIIQGEPKSRIFLKNIDQRQDTTSQFVTTIQFINPDRTKSTDINLEIKCGGPILSAEWSFTAAISISYGISEVINKEKGEIGYQNKELSAGSGLILKIKSINKIVPVITGVDGAIK